MRRVLLVVLTALAVTASTLTVAGATPVAGVGQPYVHGGQTVPTYSYAGAVRETVYVQTPLDTDHDGKRDRVAVDLVRPRTPAAVRVPVIMDASPYYQCCGRGNENEKKTYGPDGTATKLPLFYDNYFVPRGYAVAEVDLSGTSRSTGCGDVGGAAEVLGAKAAVDWINGRAAGYYGDGRTAVADWSTGRVGMIGKSWDGTIANGVAATGVEGLATIVPLSSISSWYDYTRFNGVLRSPGYVKFLASYVGGRPAGVCDQRYAAEQRASDDATGNFNAFWARRDYRLAASRVRASVFVVHGINDLNVTTNQFGAWWDELAARGVPRKIWISQDGHVDPFDYRRGVWVDTLHRWFDYWLQGLDNGIMREPQATVQRASGRWTQQPRWPAPGTVRLPVPLGLLGPSGPRTFTDAPDLTEARAVADPAATVPGRTVFLSGAFPWSVRISGSPSVSLRIRVDRPTTELTAKLVDYGTQSRIDYQSRGEGIHNLETESCWGLSTATDDACYLDTAPDYVTSDTDVLTRGWLDAAHHVSLSRRTPLVPGSWYTITVPIDTTDAVVAAGHRLGLVLTQSDQEYTTPAPTGATVTVDPSRSYLDLPVSGYGAVPARGAAPAPQVARHPSVVRPGQDRRRLLP